MRRRIIPMIVLLAMSVPAISRAAVEDFDVVKSEIDTSAVEASKTQQGSSSSALQLSVSSWSPHSFAPESAGPIGPSFSSLSAPAISGTYVHPLSSRFLGGELSALAGVGVAWMSRTGMVPGDGGIVTGQQDAYLIPVQLGAEYSATRLSRYIIPRLSAGLLPTFAMIPRSSVTDGTQTSFGLGYVLSAGAATPMRWIANGATLGVDIIYTGGSVDSGALNGAGVQLGLRFPI